MKTEHKNQRFQWLPALFIPWNMIDLVLHVAINMAEPFRISGNIVGIAAVLIVWFGLAKPHTPHIRHSASSLEWLRS